MKAAKSVLALPPITKQAGKRKAGWKKAGQTPFRNDCPVLHKQDEQIADRMNLVMDTVPLDVSECTVIGKTQKTGLGLRNDASKFSVKNTQFSTGLFSGFGRDFSQEQNEFSSQN
ncbi:hypothetical protein IM774_09805 [Erysipelotrichaceae bacterium RD49]|nr:hypothetical protein [Erysipelotrichaceae bacterium RD49]